MVPRLSVQHTEARQFLVPLRRSADQSEVAVLGEDDQVTVRKQHLAVPVSSSLPFEFSGVGVETRQDRLVEPVDEPFLQHRARELILHPVAAPYFVDGEATTGRRELDDRRAGSVAGRQEDAVITEDQRLTSMDRKLCRPWILPQEIAAIGRQTHEARAAENEQLADAGQRDQQL